MEGLAGVVGGSSQNYSEYRSLLIWFSFKMINVYSLAILLSLIIVDC